MKKIIYLLLAASALLLYYFWHWSLPTSTPIALKPAGTEKNLVLLPLDSRPVCSTMVQKLGRLAGLDVILPPKAFLDNYQEPADKEKLLIWLQNELKTTPQAIISTDILLHGGLLHTRQHKANELEQHKLLYALQNLPDSDIDLFSVIPRLLVSDQIYPDTWYWFHLLRYSTLTDQALIFNDPYITEQLEKITAQIPPDIIEKYRLLYQSNADFNTKLLQLTNARRRILIGQDDSHPFGLPHRNALKAEQQMEKSPSSYDILSYGADELSALLLARTYLMQSGYQPKIYLRYSDPATEFLYMPYMSASTGAALRNQMQLLGVKEAADEATADIIFYVNCGSSSFSPGQRQAQELNELLATDKHIGLIDLSANFEESELLMPQLLKYSVPINRLSAYAGWNTFSNSSGTALAQGIIFAGRCWQLKKAGSIEALPALYGQNLSFICERLLDDYVYQKKLHPELGPWLGSFGYTSTKLDKEEGLPTAESKIQVYLALQALKLLHQNLGQTAFYEDVHNSYFLKDITVGSRLPWGRIFEVDLQVWTEFGIVKKK